MKHLTKRSLLGAALATVMALPAVAQEKVAAVVIDGYPARALWVKEFTNFFIPEVDKRLAETGNYEMQEFHRTLVDEGLDLVFQRIRNGAVDREIRTLLKRQN